MDRWARIRRAVVWTLVASALLVQGLLLVRFAANGLSAFLLDADVHRGRWWHPVEPFFAYAGYLLVLAAGFLLARAWTRALRKPREALTEPADDAEGEEEAVAIEMPAFLRPKTRRTRPGAGALGAWTLGGLVLVVGGAALGVVETLQLGRVAVLNEGDPAALVRNSTVWIKRLMLYVAPALLVLGGATVAAAWGVYWPLPPSREVVVGQKQKSAGPARPEWQTVD